MLICVNPRTKYKADVCSTCSGYNCGEDEDCVMQNSAPTCVAAQSGCDSNDRWVS